MKRPFALAAYLTGFAMFLVPRGAMAQPPASAPPGEVIQTTEATGPSMPLVVSGVVIFGVSYIPAVAVGAVSDLDADRTLFVPVAGPWINLTQRPDCSGGSVCNHENTNKVLLVTDGVFQALGVLTTISGFLIPTQRTTVRTADSGPTWQLSPASFGKGSYGMKVVGTF
jgi:hypothetical protein